MVSRKPAERATELSQEYVQSDLDDSGEESEGHSAVYGAAKQVVKVDDDEAEEFEEDASAASDDSQEASVDEDPSEDEDEQDADSTLAVSASPSKKRNRSAEDFADSTAKKQKTNSVPPRTSIPGKEFEPPPGFALSTEKLSDLPNDTQQTFTELDNKQIWHISAPASLDITSIAQLDLEAALQGEAVLAKDGSSFHMYKTAGNGEILLLPKPNSKYRRSNASFASVLLQETSSLNDTVHTDETISPLTTASGHVFTAREPGQRRPARQQPQGLKLHNIAVGFHEDSGNMAKRGNNKENEVSAPSMDSEEGSERDDITSRMEHTSRKSAAIEDGSMKETKRRKDVEETPSKKEKKKKKKKRSQLVDTPGL